MVHLHAHFNLPSVRSTIPIHSVGTSFRTESCFILNKFTKINVQSWGDAGKTKINVLLGVALIH